MHPEQAMLARPQGPAPPPVAPAPTALRDLLARADVQINGTRPWDMRVHDARAYRRILTQWSLGAGEAYVDGDWDCERLDMMFVATVSASGLATGVTTGDGTITATPPHRRRQSTAA